MTLTPKPIPEPIPEHLKASVKATSVAVKNLTDPLMPSGIVVHSGKSFFATHLHRACESDLEARAMAMSFCKRHGIVTNDDTEWEICLEPVAEMV